MLTLVDGSGEGVNTPDAILDLNGATQAALQNLRAYVETMPRLKGTEEGYAPVATATAVSMIDSVILTEKDISALPELNPYLLLIASWQIHPDALSSGRHDLVRHIAQVCQPLASYKNITQFKVDKNYRHELLQAAILDRRIERLMYQVNGHEEMTEDFLMSRLRLAACGGLAAQGKKIPMSASMLLRGNDRRALSIMMNGTAITSFDGTPISLDILADAIKIGMERARTEVRHVANETVARVDARKEALITDGTDERFAARRTNVEDEQLVAESRATNQDRVDYESLIRNPELLRQIIKIVFPYVS